MVTWLFRLLLSIFDDDIGSDLGDESAKHTVPAPRDGDDPVPGIPVCEPSVGYPSDEDQRSVT